MNKTFYVRIKTISSIHFKFNTIFPYTNNSNRITDMHTVKAKELIKTFFPNDLK